MKNPIQSHLLLLSFAVLLPASLSAQNTVTFGFDTDGNAEGFAGTNVNGLAVAGGFITGTAAGGDPRLIRNSSTPFVTKPSEASWETVVFRVRETDEADAVVTPFDLQGVVVALNSANSGGGLTTGASYTPVDSGDGFFTVTVDISNFTADEIRYFRVDPIGAPDANGNLFEVDFIEITRSNTPPVLVSTIPVDDSVNAGLTTNLEATFDKPIFLNTTGSFTIVNLTNPSETVISLPGPDPDGSVSVDENVITINPAVDLVPGDEYAIEISVDAIKDATDLFYDGLFFEDDPNWTFTVDGFPPVLAAMQPGLGTDDAPLDGALFLGFDEEVLVGSGNLEVYRSDNTLIDTIDVESGNVIVSGSSVTVSPTVALDFGTSYYVLIDSGTFTDVWGNAYQGITDPAVWAFTTIENDPSVLFADSFNRPDSSDLDASSAGKYGSLGALTYTSRTIGLGTVQLSNGQLLAQGNEPNGNSGGIAYINRNFTDAVISESGGFSISVDINVYDTEGSGRYMSVGVGQSQAELDALSSASVLSSSGDLVVAYKATTGALEIFKNGTRDDTETINSGLPDAPVKMRIDYSLTSFSMGSTVDYEVFFDDSVIAFTSGSFTWSGTDENYINLSSNLWLDEAPGFENALFDNLKIQSNAVSSGQDYSTWAALNGASANLDEDHDLDGVANGIEYFLGGPNGNTTGFTVLPGVNSESLSTTWVKANDYMGDYPTDFVVETSEMLLPGGWAEAPVSETPGVAGTVHIDGNNVTYTFPSGGKSFARLKVTGP